MADIKTLATGAPPDGAPGALGARSLFRLLPYFGYGAGAFGACIAVFPTGQLVLYFMTDKIGLSVALASLAVAIPKIWDVFVDPAIGDWCDRESRRTGSRFSTFLLAAIAFPVSATAVFLFHWAPTVATTVCITLLLITMSTLFTVYWVTHLAAANDIDEAGVASRSELLVVRMVGQSAGGLAAGALGPLLLGVTFGLSGYVLMATCAMAIGVVTMSACALILRHIPTAGSSNQRFNFIAACRNVISRRWALGLILSNFAVNIACTYVGTMLAYVNKYFMGFGDSSLSLLFTAVMAAQIAGAVAAGRISRRFGLRRSFMVVSVCIAAVGLGFFAGSSNFTLLLIFLVGWGATTGAYTVLLHGSLLDVSKGSELAPSVTGLLLGLLFAVGKIGDTLGTLFVSLSLTSSGGIRMLQTSAEAVFTLRLWFGFLPAGLIIAGIGMVLLSDRLTNPSVLTRA